MNTPGYNAQRRWTRNVPEPGKPGPAGYYDPFRKGSRKKLTGDGPPRMPRNGTREYKKMSGFRLSGVC